MSPKPHLCQKLRSIPETSFSAELYDLPKTGWQMRSKYKPFITVRPFEGPKCRACFLLEQRGNSLYIPFPQLHSHIKAVDKKRNRKRKQQASPLARAPPTLRMEGEEMELGDCDPVMAQCTPLMWPNEVSYQDPSGADSSSQGRSS